ncbi:MAG TPA: hypothetical protein VFW65_12340 [Pseudonocardiaceae bacterium]|nr:hypothetical protein [Pseudonocardiaceae bacterium]
MSHKDTVDLRGESGAHEQGVDNRAELEPHLSGSVVDGGWPREDLLIVLVSLVGFSVGQRGLVISYCGGHESSSSRGEKVLVSVERKSSV